MRKIGIFAAAFATAAVLNLQPCAAVSYKYDKIGRLICATYKSGATISYTYDSSGNISKIKQNGAKKLTITFNANGGMCNTVDKTVIQGQKYGNLPDAEKDGCFFDGWYTEPDGGQRITADDTVENAENHMLYAHWSTHNYMISERLVGKTVYTCTHCGDSYAEISPEYEWYYNGESPYAITSAEQLGALGILVNSGISFEGSKIDVCTDIAADSITVIGTDEHPFNGVFNGGGHKITLNSAKNGIFGCIGQFGVVMNLSVDLQLDAELQTAGMIANENHGKIQNCAASGEVSGNSHRNSVIGGIAGKNYGIIYNCLYSGDIVYDGNRASECVNQKNGEYMWDVLEQTWGTICGRNDGKIEHCYYGIEDDIRNPKHSGAGSTGEYKMVHMYTERYYIFGPALYEYVGDQMDEYASKNTEFVRWRIAEGTLPTLIAD